MGLRLIDLGAAAQRSPGGRLGLGAPPVGPRWCSTSVEPTLAGAGAPARLGPDSAVAYSLCVFSLGPFPPLATSGCCNASAPRRLGRLAPPVAHCSLRRWLRPVYNAGLKEEEEEARCVPQPMPQPRLWTCHGARAAALARAHETCMDGHGLESSTFLRRRLRCCLRG